MVSLPLVINGCLTVSDEAVQGGTHEQRQGSASPLPGEAMSHGRHEGRQHRTCADADESADKHKDAFTHNAVVSSCVRRSAVSHAIEGHVGGEAQLQLAPRLREAMWVGSPAVNKETPRDDEQAAADAICAVVDVAHCERLVPSGVDKMPDWRMTTADGRVADVEVTLCTDEAAMRFTQSLSPLGSARRWPDERLKYEWTIVVSDHAPTDNRRLPIGKMMRAVIDVLVSVEGQHGSPQHLKDEADTALRLGPGVARYLGGTRFVDVVKAPQHAGSGQGVVCTYGSTTCGGRVDHRRLIPPIQERIDDKAGDAQLDNAPDLKWLAVMLEGEPAWLLNDFFGLDSPSPHPSLAGISFDYFDEVWVAAKALDGENYVVLRLFKPGDSQQSYIVPRA